MNKKKIFFFFLHKSEIYLHISSENNNNLKGGKEGILHLV